MSSRALSRPDPLQHLRPRAAGARGNATQHIAEALTAAIVERRLLPGTKLAEQRLADRFRVSRTLVRQALNQLSRDRLVTLSPARGARVAEPSLDEARQVFEVRDMLERALVQRLCGRLDAAACTQLQAHLQREAEAVARADVAGRTRLLADFHVLLARLAGNEVLAQLLADLLARSSLIALTVQSDLSAAQSHAEHVALAQALKAGDADGAQRLLQQHLAHVLHQLYAPARGAAATSPAEPTLPPARHAARPAAERRTPTPPMQASP